MSQMMKLLPFHIVFPIFPHDASKLYKESEQENGPSFHSPVKTPTVASQTLREGLLLCVMSQEMH